MINIEMTGRPYTVLTAFQSRRCTRSSPRWCWCKSPRAGCTRSSVCLLPTARAPVPCERISPGCPGVCGLTWWFPWIRPAASVSVFRRPGRRHDRVALPSPFARCRDRSQHLGCLPIASRVAPFYYRGASRPHYETDYAACISRYPRTDWQ